MLKRVVKVSTQWCQPCKVYGKIFKEVSESEEFSGILFQEIDAEEDEDFVEECSIRSVPTTLFFDEDGLLLDKSGIITKYDLEQIIRSILND